MTWQSYTPGSPFEDLCRTAQTECVCMQEIPSMVCASCELILFVIHMHAIAFGCISVLASEPGLHCCVVSMVRYLAAIVSSRMNVCESKVPNGALCHCLEAPVAKIHSFPGGSTIKWTTKCNM
ncbi:hypothetical protein M758_UG026300 [Ceratodon purpureus]|nr:hypothetical protein M758_UG026300 [Ceratodon purpureus]